MLLPYLFCISHPSAFLSEKVFNVALWVCNGNAVFLKWEARLALKWALNWCGVAVECLKAALGGFVPPTSPHYISVFRLFSKATVLGIECFYLRLPLELQRQHGTLRRRSASGCCCLAPHAAVHHCFSCAPNRWSHSSLPCCSAHLKARHDNAWEYSGANCTLHHCSSCALLHFPFLQTPSALSACNIKDL